jgi:hypothetical protein
MALELYMVGVIVEDMPRATEFYPGSASTSRTTRTPSTSSRSR